MKHALLVVAALTTVGISGCDDDEDGPPAATQTIWEIVQGDDNLSMVEEQLIAAGLDDQLDADGANLTLFAPSNAAMETLLSTLGLDNFSSISEQVTQAVLAYHVANSEHLSSALTNGAALTTLQGEQIMVVTTTTGEKTLDTGATSNSKVTTADRDATNGVVHVVDVVLVPPTIGDLIVSTLGTVLQPILLGSDFTTLSGGLQMANAYAEDEGLPTLTEILLNEAPGTEDFLYTVFAPTNATFEALLEDEILDSDTLTGEEWYGIISHHVVADEVTYGGTDDYAQGGQFNTLATATSTRKLTVLATNAPPDQANGIMTGIVIDSNGDTTPEAQIAVLDVLTATGANPAQNGIINVIAGFLSPM
ncbi:MAG TPA: fasciclin domain-containing protein [Chryseosolibacter sp.]|nr:fasciclin domain-containing protein [Chryseosolibacter sp.]